MKLTFEKALELVKKHIENAYTEAHELCKTIDGSETQQQLRDREYIQDELAVGLLEQVNQNLSDNDIENEPDEFAKEKLSHDRFKKMVQQSSFLSDETKEALA